MNKTDDIVSNVDTTTKDFRSKKTEKNNKKA